jgi:Lipocalin-like domain
MTETRVEGEHPLVGGWRLRAWVSIGDDGSAALPMGATPDGLLAYTADRTMVGIMSPGDRPRFATDDVTGGTPEEQARAFATFIAYGGSWDADEDTVTHLVETSLFPNWIGTTQRRRWELDETGRYLTLTSPPLVLGGTTRVQRLRWERVGGEAPSG